MTKFALFPVGSLLSVLAMGFYKHCQVYLAFICTCSL